MILTDDKQFEALESRRIVEDPLTQYQDPPPTYSSLSPAASSSAFGSKRSNYVSISGLHNSVKETVIIDPDLFIPQTLRPVLAYGETEETRKNLKLESTHGDVSADITVVEQTEPNVQFPKRNTRATMQIKSTHGGITARIHGPPNRHAFVLHAQSLNGDIRLCIPRSFHGPVVISNRHGSVRFSDGINQNLTTFGEMNNTRRCFLGDFSRWTDARDGWTGDELNVDVKHGNVKVHYDDDAAHSLVGARPTLLNRLFGF